MTAPISNASRDDLSPGDDRELLASDELEGLPVYSEAGGRIGKLHHLLIDRDSGQIGCAVLSFGGILGIGDTRFPVPWKALEYDADRRGYVAHVDEELLPAAPGYLPGQEPIYSGVYTAGLFGYYGLAWPVVMPPAAASSVRDSAATEPCASRGDMFISSEKVAGSAVHDRRGQRLGSIKRLLIDAASGQVRAVLLSREGRFGVPERTDTISWNSVTYDPETGGFVCSSTKDDREMRTHEESWAGAG